MAVLAFPLPKTNSKHRWKIGQNCSQTGSRPSSPWKPPMAFKGELAVSFRECMFITKHGMSQGLDLKTHRNGWVSGWISDRNKRLRNRWFMTHLFARLFQPTCDLNKGVIIIHWSIRTSRTSICIYGSPKRRVFYLDLSQKKWPRYGLALEQGLRNFKILAILYDLD